MKYITKAIAMSFYLVFILTSSEAQLLQDSTFKKLMADLKNGVL